MVSDEEDVLICFSRRQKGNSQSSRRSAWRRSMPWSAEGGGLTPKTLLKTIATMKAPLAIICLRCFWCVGLMAVGALVLCPWCSSWLIVCLRCCCFKLYLCLCNLAHQAPAMLCASQLSQLLGVHALVIE